MTHQAPPTTYRPPYLTRPPMSGLAIAGFVVSLLWGFGFLSPIGLALSLFGLKETNRGRKRGFGLAIAGTVLGALGTIGLGAFFGPWAIN